MPSDGRRNGRLGIRRIRNADDHRGVRDPHERVDPENALATSNRLTRAVDRIRALSREADGNSAKDDRAEARRTRLLRFAERRTTLLVRSLKAFYASVDAFAAASLISLLAAVSLAAHLVTVHFVAQARLGSCGRSGGCGHRSQQWTPQHQQDLRSLGARHHFRPMTTLSSLPVNLLLERV